MCRDLKRANYKIALNAHPVDRTHECSGMQKMSSKSFVAFVQLLSCTHKHEDHSTWAICWCDV
ncbi:hypothetical protein BGZ60DRAFT_423342 [Tricladium varicosporioides]|nr:hypothetical protein BGZ60DRAFT_423342 [Hymenoscyphus varicosporioides]